MKNQETVIFDKVSLNEGKAYDNISGIFTAPLDGIYSFTWTVLTKYGKCFLTEIVLNGKKVVLNHTDGRGHDGGPMSTSHANIKMKKGDKVWIRTHSTSGLFAHANWCFFSGSKLQHISNDTKIKHLKLNTYNCFVFFNCKIQSYNSQKFMCRPNYIRNKIFYTYIN